MTLKQHLDNRIGDRVRYVFLEEGETLGYVPDEIRQCIVYLGYKDSNGKPRVAGSAFWLVNSKHGYGPAYLVTAAHVLRDIKKLGQGDCVLIRENFPEGAKWLRSTNIDRWRTISDKTVDVAMLKIPIDGDHAGWPSGQLITKESAKFDLKHIDLGDEVFFPGMFWRHKGSARNIPIVRTGNIAALREEKIDTGDDEYGPMDAYLVEVRSVGGLSGSPVFMDIIAARVAKEIAPVRPQVGWERFKLIGMISGHFKGTESEEKSSTLSEADLERLNMGIAFVTPGEKILEVLELFADEEEKEIEEWRQRRRATVSLDSAPNPNVVMQITKDGAEIPIPSQDQFINDLKKASRKKDK
jgi:hypothetical protein